VASIEKNEQVVGERVGFEDVANDGEQTVEGFSHVDGRGAERDAGVGRDGQHGDVRAWMISAMERGEASVKRMAMPLGRMISAEGFEASTMLIGTKDVLSLGGVLGWRYFLSQ